MRLLFLAVISGLIILAHLCHAAESAVVVTGSAIEIGQGPRQLPLGVSNYASTAGLFDGKQRPIDNVYLLLNAEDTDGAGLHEVLIPDVSGVYLPFSYRLPMYVRLEPEDLAYDPVGDKLYASVGSAGTGSIPANSVATINYRTGKVESVVAVGASPKTLRISEDGTLLYVGIESNQAIQVIDLATGLVTRRIETGMKSAISGIAIKPGRPGLIAVMSTSGELALYLDGARLAQSAQVASDSYADVAFSSDGRVLAYTGLIYWLNYGDSGFKGQPVTVTPTPSWGAPGSFLAERNGLVYGSAGVVDGSTGKVIAVFSAQGTASAIDFDLSRILTANDSGFFSLDLETHEPLWEAAWGESYSLKYGRLVRCAPGYVAFHGSDGILFLIRTPQADVAPAIKAEDIRNAASLANGAVSPGEIVSIFGTHLGPYDPRTMVEYTPRVVEKTLGDVQVLFGTTAAPILYAGPNQLNVVVPYAVSGKTSVPVQVVNSGAASNIVSLSVAETAPGIFTTSGTGNGSAAALNQDYTLNSPAVPAAKGSVILLYATGEGQTSPAGVDGYLTSYTLPAPLEQVQVTVDGQPAEVLYAGAAPGLVAGVIQVNVRVPGQARSGALPVVLRIGSESSSQQVAVSVQ